MQMEPLLVLLLVGAVAGLLAGFVVKGGGFGLLGDTAVGVIGAFFGGWLLPKLGVQIGDGILSVIASATIGAVILLFIFRLIRRA